MLVMYHINSMYAKYECKLETVNETYIKLLIKNVSVQVDMGFGNVTDLFRLNFD